MRRARTILARLLLVLVIIAGVAGLGGYLYARRSLPAISGALAAPGLRAPIEIIRDADAVPHIYAQSRRDALFGLGYVHAQDRLWQMEYQRRVGQARLAEVFGAPMVPMDRFLRTLGTYRSAESAWERLAPDTQADITAYTDGINHFIGGRPRGELQPEFTLLGYSPEPWRGPDVLVWAKIVAYDLSGTYLSEWLAHDIAQVVGLDRTQQLLPGAAGDAPITESGVSITASPLAPAAGLSALDGQLRAMLNAGHTGRDGLGSNSWVVDGSRTASGQPILANDPHLGARAPSIWYLAHLSGGDLDVVGSTLPGLPAVVIGRNRTIAWGMTNVNPDVQDIFVERLDQSGRLAEYEGQMAPMQLITETIKVRGGPDVQQLVRITRHGPLISDSITVNNATRPPEQRRIPPGDIALRWTALDPEDTTVEAFLQINVAQDWDAFRRALGGLVAPAQHFVYADTAGNIGSQVAGHIPIRVAGNGSLPAAGWSKAYAWEGWVPFEQLPSSFNPPEHVIVAANHRPAPAGYRHYLGRDWSEPYRAQRIAELLAAKPQLSLDDHAAIQADTVSLHARALLPELLALASPRDERERRAVALLREWDGDVRGESAAAAIFEAWFFVLPRQLAGDEIGERLLGRYEQQTAFLSRFLVQSLADPASPWCDRVDTASQERCADTVTQALGEALDLLGERMGGDMAAWRWDRVHTVILGHQPLDQNPLTRPLLRRSAPNGGDWHTVNVGTFAFDRPFEQYLIAGYRQIIDLSSTANGRFIQAIGQSGHPLSPHYDDYLDDWRNVRYRSMRLERAAVEQGALGTLRLTPST